MDNYAKTPVRPYNVVVRVGVWITVIAAALWVGGKAIKYIEVYLPFAIGVGIAVMIGGLVLQFRKSKGASAVEKKKELLQ